MLHRSISSDTAAQARPPDVSARALRAASATTQACHTGNELAAPGEERLRRQDPVRARRRRESGDSQALPCAAARLRATQTA